MSNLVKRNSRKKILASFLATAIILLVSVVPAFATLSVSTSTISGADDTVGNLLGIICSVFRYIGILLLVWSIGMLILAFKNEDADSKSKAMMLLVVSFVLIGVKSLVDTVINGI